MEFGNSCQTKMLWVVLFRFMRIKILMELAGSWLCNQPQFGKEFFIIFALLSLFL
jgi:hypothetical protein